MNEFPPALYTPKTTPDCFNAACQPVLVVTSVLLHAPLQVFSGLEGVTLPVCQVDGPTETLQDNEDEGNYDKDYHYSPPPRQYIILDISNSKRLKATLKKKHWLTM